MARRAPGIRPIDSKPGGISVSHIVTVATEVRDPAAVHAACRRLGLPEPAHGTATLFEGRATGLLVRLPDWLYPVVCDMRTGELRYDNFGGHWGDPCVRQESLGEGEANSGNLSMGPCG